MKIQYIAVVFIIIILPISLVMSSYISSQIDTINLQTSYNSKLTDSTYDAVKALQINTVNNRYSSVSNSKIRDIEAAVNIFYTSLSNNENLTKEELKDYVPALVFTLYDGYYIYSKYDNVYPEDPKKAESLQPLSTTEADTNYGLKPYIYYSCRYKDGNSREFVVNYTLDNAITIYGTFIEAGVKKYKTLSGYLIDPNAVTVKEYAEDNPLEWSLEYDDVEITEELLTEHLLFSTYITDEITGESKYDEGDYNYLVYNGQKIYYDKQRAEEIENNEEEDTQTPYFLYQNYAKSYITKSYVNEKLVDYLEKRTNGGKLYSTSSFEYYYNAKQFSEDVISLTRGINQQEHAINEKGEKYSELTDAEGNSLGFSVDTGTDDIFVASDTNDPLVSGSTFNENRIAVIRKSIETNLTAAIANYSMYSGNNYEFALPVLSDVDWAKITNKVSLISFLQGIPIGHKYYNNYCVITNDNNEEVINKENIYIVTENTRTSEREYHLPGCHELAKNEGLIIKETYSNLSFIRQTVRISEGVYYYFYPQSRDFDEDGNNDTMTGCYYCIVNATSVYSADEIIEGILIEKDDNWDDIDIEFKGNSAYERLNTIRQFYIIALGRERHDLYQANIEAFKMNEEEEGEEEDP